MSLLPVEGLCLEAKEEVVMVDMVVVVVDMVEVVGMAVAVARVRGRAARVVERAKAAEKGKVAAEMDVSSAVVPATGPVSALKVVAVVVAAGMTAGAEGTDITLISELL
eukprot:EG_transcript_43289